MTVVRIAVTAGAFALIARKVGFGAVLHALATPTRGGWPPGTPWPSSPS